MMSSLEHYLNCVARELRYLPAALRDNEIRELRSHLEHLIEDCIGEGSSREEATRTALSQFGDARSVGNKIFDVWDGRVPTPQRILMAIFCGVVFWVGSCCFWLEGMTFYSMWPAQALFPELLALFIGLLAVIPFLTGSILSLWLGRHSWGLQLLFGGLTSVLVQFVETCLNRTPLSTSIFAGVLFWQVSLSALGVWAANRLYMRNRRLQLASGISDFPLHAPRNWRKLKRGTASALALSLVFGTGAKIRFDSVFHPRSSLQAVRTRLLLSEDLQLQTPRITQLHELDVFPSPGGDRVAFEAILSAQPGYRDLRLAYMRKLLRLFSGKGDPNAVALKASIRRLETNAFKIRGVAVVKNTPEGWQIDESSFDFSRLHGWAYDIYFRE